MAAPNLETLLDFEGILEESFKDYLSSNITSPSAQYAITADTADLQTPRVQIMWNDSGARDELQVCTNAGGDLQEYLDYGGELVFQIITDNNTDSQAIHRALRNQIRALMQRNIINPTLQYYEIRYVRSGGTNFDTDGDYFITTISFSIIISIKPEEYPTP